MGLIGDALSGIVSGVADIGTNIYNTIQNKRMNDFNMDMAERNAKLQEDVAYNGLGMRISDAERNGISKWAVVGDSANGGIIGQANTHASNANFNPQMLDTIRTIAENAKIRQDTENAKKQEKVLEEQTNNLIADRERENKLADSRIANEEFARRYAEKNNLPLGVAPNIQSSILGATGEAGITEQVTNSMRTIGNVVAEKGLIGAISDILVKGKSKYSDEQIEEAFNQFSNLDVSEQEKVKSHLNGSDLDESMPNTIKKHITNNRKAKFVNKSNKQKRSRVSSRSQGGLAPGHIPPEIYIRNR